jgi:glycosyltransferase involved in cell wall biosynthesis
MKIALLSFEYPPETGFGGIGTYTWYQARALARLGHEVHVLAGSMDRDGLESAEQEGVFVHRYRTQDLWTRFAGLFGRFGCHWTRQRLENAWSMYRGLKLLMKQHQFDLLEMPECGAEGALVTRLVDIPSVVRLHSPSRLIMPFYGVPKADILMCSWIEQLAIRRATALTSCSKFLAIEAREKMGVHRPIRVIPNGIDLTLFDQEPAAEINTIYGLPPGKVTVLFAGRMERRKGIHLCAAIAEIVLRRRDVTFLFAGEDLFGYVRQTLLPSLQEVKLLGSVRYLGKLNLQQLRACARAVDIYLLPSLWENCPYSCLEAMAAGRAIVCSDQGGMPELIEHGINGLLAQTGSPESFAAELETIIDDGLMRRALGSAARDSVERRFGARNIACLSADFYRQIL